MSARQRVAPLLELPGVGRLVLAPLARSGYRRYLASGETPHRSYVAMRKLYAAHPVAFERLVTDASAERPLFDLPENPGGLLSGRLDDAVRALDADGLYVAATKLPNDMCSELVEIATTAECHLVDPVDGSPRRARFDPAHVVAPRYDVDERDLVMAPVVQRLMSDPSLLAIAQRYLRAAPILDLLAMWWSAAADRPASSAAAQQFHFDLDRLRFVKVFVYLTDVDERHGPHVFVRKSHRSLPRRFRRDGRRDDAEVESAFGSDVVTVAGARGTMFLADTRALHKGAVVAEGHRLVFQMEYASSLFGQAYSRLALAGVHPVLADAVRRYPSAFERFTLIPARTTAAPN